MSLAQSKPICKIKLPVKEQNIGQRVGLLTIYIFFKIIKLCKDPDIFSAQTGSLLPTSPLHSPTEKLILIVMISFDVTFPRAISPNGWSVSLPKRKSSR